LATGLERKFDRESQGVIIQIGKPERILETFEELANVLLNENS
jgi:hypothetical protein